MISVKVTPGTYTGKLEPEDDLVYLESPGDNIYDILDLDDLSDYRIPVKVIFIDAVNQMVTVVEHVPE